MSNATESASCSAARPPRSFGAAPGDSRPSERREPARARQEPSGPERRQRAGRERDRNREAEHAGVDRHGEAHAGRLWKQELLDDLLEVHREREAERGSHEREQPALCQLQLQQSPARRTDRLADGNLVLASSRPEDQKVGDVGAAQEQQHAAEHEQPVHHRDGSPTRQGRQAEAGKDPRRHRLELLVLHRMRVGELPRQHLELALDFHERPAGCFAHDELVEDAAVARRRRRLFRVQQVPPRRAGQPCIDAAGARDAAEGHIGDPDDRKRLAVQRDRFAERGARRSKCGLRQATADHGDGRAEWTAVFVCSEGPAGAEAYAEHLEEVCRDHRGRRLRREAARHGEAGTAFHDAGNPAERLRARPDVGEILVRHARGADAVVAPLAEPHNRQRARVRDARMWTPEQPVSDADNRGDRPDRAGNRE